VLDRTDGSGLSWRDKFETFIDVLNRGSSTDRTEILNALETISTGVARVRTESSTSGNDGNQTDDQPETVDVLANVQEATGDTNRDQRTRQQLAFNTPFFPDIFVCSEVMSEGVDLHRYCRHVIHHDLAWNPSDIEQRTGRVDRLGCKAQDRHPIQVYLPFIAGAGDERQFRVMSDRDQWFRIVMGQEEVARLIDRTSDEPLRRLPTAFTKELAFDLGLESVK
jgi:hypothetical protein